jgi:hypothetical protein
LHHPEYENQKMSKKKKKKKIIEIKKCPQEDCCFWGKKGQLAAPGLYDSAESAKPHLRILDKEGCWHYERCTREYPNGTDDYFKKS